MGGHYVLSSSLCLLQGVLLWPGPPTLPPARCPSSVRPSVVGPSGAASGRLPSTTSTPQADGRREEEGPAALGAVSALGSANWGKGRDGCRWRSGGECSRSGCGSELSAACRCLRAAFCFWTLCTWEALQLRWREISGKVRLTENAISSWAPLCI